MAFPVARVVASSWRTANPSVAMSCVAERSVIEKAMANRSTVCVGATKAMAAISAETRSWVGTIQPRRCPRRRIRG